MTADLHSAGIELEFIAREYLTTIIILPPRTFPAADQTEGILVVSVHLNFFSGNRDIAERNFCVPID